MLDRTPFYAEGGGQIGDRGELIGPNGRLDVTDTQRVGDAIVHLGTLEGSLSAGDAVRAEVDEGRRWAAARNHTGTHLLHRALRDVLGEGAKQAGSWVGPEGLRFDFPASRRDAARGAARGRADRECPDPAGRDGHARVHADRAGPGARRRHVLRGEVRPRVGARRPGRRLQQGAVRRHARRLDRADRPAADHRRVERRRRPAADRGGHRRGGHRARRRSARGAAKHGPAARRARGGRSATRREPAGPAARGGEGREGAACRGRAAGRRRRAALRPGSRQDEGDHRLVRGRGCRRPCAASPTTCAA